MSEHIEHSESELRGEQLVEQPVDTQPELSDDPIVVLQVLQVKEREYEQVLRRLIEERELVRDGTNHTVESFMAKSSGMLGIITVAFTGRRVPKEISGKLDRLIEYEVALDERIELMSDTLAFVLELKRKADIDPDDKNTLILRQRCIVALEKEFDDEQLIGSAKKARADLEEYKAMLASIEEEARLKVEAKKAKKESKNTKSKVNLEDKILANS